MKKTTYIIIAILVVLVGAAFAFPPLMFRKTGMTVSVIRSQGNTVTIATETFMTLDLQRIYNVACEDDTVALQVVVEQCDTIDRPLFVMDKAWADNISLSTDNHQVSLVTDLHSLKANGSDISSAKFSRDMAVLAEVLVPAGMLGDIKAGNARVTLRKFNGGSMRVRANDGVETDSCYFSSLSVQ